MKISAILLVTVALAQNAEIPLKCWHCDAMSFEECASKGQEETCLVSFQKKYYTFTVTLLTCYMSHVGFLSPISVANIAKSNFMH